MQKEALILVLSLIESPINTTVPEEGEAARHAVNKWKLRSSYLAGNLSLHRQIL